MSKPDDFGTVTNGVRIFNREPLVRTSVVRPVGYHWECPMDGCEGEMKFTGRQAPVTAGGRPAPPAMEHTCEKCGFTAAIVGKRYPYVDYERVGGQ